MSRSIRSSQRRLRRAANLLAALRAALSSTANALLHKVPGRGVVPSRALGDPARAAAAEVMIELNTRGPDGEFLLAGDNGASSLFAVDGSYLGRQLDRVIVMTPGAAAGLALAASALTSRAPFAGAVDVLSILAHANAPGARLDEPSRSNLRSKLALASAQVQHVQGKLDAALDMLFRADADATPAEAVAPSERLASSSEQLPHLFTVVEAARSLAERALSVIPRTP